MIARRTLLLAGLAGTIVTNAHASSSIGELAPDFDRTDINGARVRLSALSGRIVVLEWSNPICPFAGKHYTAGTMQALQQEARDAGGAWLTVFSDPRDVVGHVSDLEAEFVTEQRKSKATGVLLDHDTTLARSFG